MILTWRDLKARLPDFDDFVHSLHQVVVGRVAAGLLTQEELHQSLREPFSLLTGFASSCSTVGYKESSEYFSPPELLEFCSNGELIYFLLQILSS